MTQAELAERAGRPAKTINEVIHGKSAITPETALQLERVLGVSATVWNNLERNYRESLARMQEKADLANVADWHKRFPWRLLVQRGWVAAQDTDIEKTRALLGFFGIASPEQWEQVVEAPQAAFRHSSTFESDSEPLALWLRRGVQLATAIHCREYDRTRFRAALTEARKLTRKPVEDFIPRLVDLCADSGVALVFVQELPKCRVHGATRWLSKNKALVQLSLRYKTDDHLWFTFFHEAAHILLHPKKATFLETDQSSGEKEKEANEFAAEFLIPDSALRPFRSRDGRISRRLVESVSRDLGVAPGILVGRLQYEGLLPFENLNSLKRKLAWDEGAVLAPDQRQAYPRT